MTGSTRAANDSRPKFDAGALLRSLGKGAPIDEACAAAGLSREGFDGWWAGEVERRLPALTGTRSAAVGGAVEILRDDRGLPHVLATSDRDLFFGYGFAMAQDRLFQMDLRRRRGHGRLAELLGPDGLEGDRIARTVGLHMLAEAELARLDSETRGLLDAFADGVNAHVATANDRLPIEYDIVGAAPAPWTALDSVACATSWRWQLTGRPWVIAVPEVVKRALGDGPLYQAFLSAQGEADDVSIVPPGSYPTSRVDMRHGAATPQVGAGTSADGGSNNWVVAGSRTTTGRPILASDPHMPYESASSFFEVHLQGGSFDVAGAGLVGLPGVTFGRNRQAAWGITNNICSLRDLYAEGPDAVIGERREQIDVRGSRPVELMVRETRHGPIADELLPPIAAGTGPVSIRWAGALACDWIAAQLRINRARSVAGLGEAVRGWIAPTFSLVMADDAGRIGYRATGAIPIREVPERGYRPGDDPTHEWAGLIPPDGMPQVTDPPTGFIATANTRPAPDDFPYPLAGTWDEGLRARRIGERIVTETPVDGEAMARLQTDAHVHRAATTVSLIVRVVESALGPGEMLQRQALDVLAAWNGEASHNSAGAAIYEVVFARWTQAVVAEQLGAEHAVFLAPWAAGLAASLLGRDDAGWFTSAERRHALLGDVFRAAVTEVAATLGPDASVWRWGELHRLRLPHPLSQRGDLATLLERPPVPMAGDPWTLSNAGFAGDHGDRAWEATSGAGYRLVVDFGESAPALYSITAEGQSAMAGSPHADDQLDDYLAGRLRPVPLERGQIERTAISRLVLLPLETGGER